MEGQKQDFTTAAMSAQKQSMVLPILVTVLVTAVVVGMGMYLWQQSIQVAMMPEATNMMKQQELAGDFYTTEQNSEPMAPATTMQIQMGYHLSTPLFMLFSSDIEKQTGEYVESFYSPESPDGSAVIFVSTSGNVTGEHPNLVSTNKIYSYNIKTGELIKLYQESEKHILRTVGLDGSKLILMKDLIDNSPGPCFSVWSDWKNFESFDLAGDMKALQPYTIPDYQVKKGQQEASKCMVDNFGEK